jgi:DNA-binding XRE family transcriptional regulator
MANGRRIAILRELTGRLALFVNGQRTGFPRGKTQLALLACLFDNSGRAISYKRPFTIISRRLDNETNRHLLRRHMSLLRELLVTYKTPYVIALVHEIGYALCEVAENPRHTSTMTRRRKDLSQLERNVRQLRIAAGLTQTALAKRSGMNRSHLSRLESGARTPHLLRSNASRKPLNCHRGHSSEERPTALPANGDCGMLQLSQRG